MHDDRIKNLFYQPHRYNNCVLDLKKKGSVTCCTVNKNQLPQKYVLAIDNF